MLQQAKMPYARFSTEAVATRSESGETSYINKHFVTITPAGGKDEVYKEAEAWLGELSQKAMTRGPFDANAAEYGDWHKRFSAAFDAYKAGLEIPEDGTSLKACMAFLPAEIANCASLHIYTIESLADCNEESIRRLGMGGRTLKQKAQKILESQSGNKVAEENAALRLEVAQLREQVQALINRTDQAPVEPIEESAKRRGRPPKE